MTQSLHDRRSSKPRTTGPSFPEPMLLIVHVYMVFSLQMEGLQSIPDLLSSDQLARLPFLLGYIPS